MKIDLTSFTLMTHMEWTLTAFELTPHSEPFCKFFSRRPLLTMTLVAPPKNSREKQSPSVAPYGLFE